MSKFKFEKATKKRSRLRLAFVGPAGSGKTYSALSVATNLIPGARVAVIDTERGSASKYANFFKFDVLELDYFSPTEYVEAIHEANNQGYDIIVIDSLSHAWNAKGGALDEVDKIAKRQKGNSFSGWRDVTPKHNEMVDAILQSPAHMIATMRSKSEYIIEEDSRGKKVPRKVGMAPVQRDGLEFEFDVVGDLDYNHAFTVTKSRCSAVTDAYIEKPGEELAKTLIDWLTDGVDAPEPMREPKPEGSEDEADPEIERRLANPAIAELYLKLGYTRAKQVQGLLKFRDDSKLIEVLNKRVAEQGA